MAEFGISIAEKLIEAIGCEMIEEICDLWGYKSQLEELKDNVSTIKKVLLDVVEAKRELSNEERDFIEKLKDAVYDADDLFDELHTLAELEQLKPLSKRGKFFEKVRCFFSSKNQMGQAYRISREVKNIMKRLGDVVHTHNQYGFNVDYKPISRRTDHGTCSYVDPHKVIGREKDKEAMIDMLLNRNVNDHFCFLTIVGVGGLGKTVVAQLLFDDENVIKEYPTRIWVCVSDHVGESFDESEILCKILESVTRKKVDRTSMELIHNQFQEELRGKKYLLVLDDVWNEDREKWLKLENFLMLGHGSSRIVVTTRSKRTAEIIGSKHVFELKGLSEEHSWQLFELMAFKKGHEREYSQEFVEIGKNIVEKCYGSPLAIRVVGSLLYGQDISKWQLFENIGLAEIRKGDNDIMSLLELSYHNLEPSMKACFSFCAVFPKDFKIEKEELISLWIAHGFIVPLDEGQSIEDAAMEHFLILFHRCFFEKKERCEHADVDPIKIHDLLHDVAQNVAKGEIRVVDSIRDNMEDKVRHVRYKSDRYPQISSFYTSKIRSFFCSCQEIPLVLDTYLEKWMCLRVLDLSKLDIIRLPSSIGKLFHLRYLNMSEKKALVELPNAITRLHNLQTLLLCGCKCLRELPKDFCRLVKLRHLDLLFCFELACMPWGMDKLTSLKILSYFVVGGRSLKAQSDHDELESLKYLTEMRGKLEIKIGENYRRDEGRNGGSGGYLKSMKHLTHVFIIFDENLGGCVDHDEAALEMLELPSNVEVFYLKCYRGTTIPRWGRAVDNWAISFSKLAQIFIDCAPNLQELPLLSKLSILESRFEGAKDGPSEVAEVGVESSHLSEVGGDKDNS